MTSSRSPKETAEFLCKDTMKTKAESKKLKLILLGILAGVYIGFGAELATLVSIDSTQYLGFGLSKLLSGIVFSVGLILVIVAGAELFTGNTLICMPVYNKESTIKKLIRNWSIVYIANFVGAILLVTLIVASGVWKFEHWHFGAKAIEIANAKVNLSFVEAFTRGILCNWLVCLAVWMATTSKDTTGKILGVLFPVTAFIACGFEHCIANMYFIPKAIMLKTVPEVVTATKMGIEGLSNLSIQGFIFKNLIPVTLGNIIGAIGPVGGFYWLSYLKTPSCSQIINQNENKSCETHKEDLIKY